MTEPKQREIVEDLRLIDESIVLKTKIDRINELIESEKFNSYYYYEKLLVFRQLNLLENELSTVMRLIQFNPREIKPHEQRLFDEHKELKEKIDNLRGYLDKFDTKNIIDEQNYQNTLILRRQLDVMIQYEKILMQRINKI